MSHTKQFPKLSAESQRAVEQLCETFTNVIETGERPAVLAEFLDIVRVETEKERNRANTRLRVCDEVLAITAPTAPAPRAVYGKAKRTKR